ncbi:hypothetical protein [Salisediminibacterium halotolerans]|uniref:Gas vesicle protein n=1 Tax=Salisediminibacterium halotolerans TaxID=517425 RepID=A0A1H9UFW7_9BACI|nr:MULTISPECIES: hypothetical protein [Salisediminibacterium]RLJ69271.1 hypothetical protein BCL39_2766 [Actinophytocola xinjiangensis]RPE86994.1 hypothetical protein EDD67_1858 [Salisediminibacterium halotolerans]TWG32273.1 hypothetical protein BCL52_2761 [Salisediminibacterium halotolerans]SES08335.1 hypothetical protein SAMN05444126_11429 [Salisediminibacterium haloalkalitolerans]GEL08941.1 hypothetical protein SHA02_23570 [Salisediminibacterium halotolerans]
MNTKQWVIGGSLIGLAAGSIFVASNKQARNTVAEWAGTTKHWTNVISENREEVINQLRQSSERIQTIVEEASKDVEQIMESTQSMKGHIYQLLDAVQDSYDEVKTVKAKLESPQMQQESLPSGAEEQSSQ